MYFYLKKSLHFLKAVLPTLLLSFLFIACNFTEYSTKEISKRQYGNSLEDSLSKLVDVNSNHDFKFTNTTLVSWNICDLGRTKNPDELKEIANILRNFDIVAIQEVVAKDPAGAQAVAKIADELNRMGSKWDYRISDPTMSPSVYISERYAFLWKTSKVSLVHRAYLDIELEEVCNREPYIAAFKVKGQSEPFYVINFHSRRYNERPEEEIIHFLDYQTRLKSNRIIIAGDFNLDEKHHVWKPFYRNGFRCALQNARTTLKMKCKNGEYLNHAIDNMYFAQDINLLHSGNVDFVGSCSKLKWGRALSDHLPVFMEFNIK